MRGFKALLLTTVTTALLAPLALAPRMNAQVSINIGEPPVCSYGYYDYAPYACAPVGYYGPGYFYNGIFLGMGPWSGWGYNHGWGGHRFSSGGGGSYTGGFHGAAYNRGRAGRPSAVRTNSRAGSAPRASTRHSYATTSRGNQPNHASHSNGARGGSSHGASHPTASGGGGSHGGGSKSHDDATHR
jgi:hypothetical protein